MTTQTATVGAGEWIYIDASGSPHTLTTDQTFTLELTDGGTTTVDLEVDGAQSITTTDGYNLVLRRQTDQANTARDIGFLVDAKNGAVHHNLRGEIVIACDNSGIEQIWRVSQLTADNVDDPGSITLLKLEDQFGNVMDLPSTGAWAVA